MTRPRHRILDVFPSRGVESQLTPGAGDPGNRVSESGLRNTSHHSHHLVPCNTRALSLIIDFKSHREAANTWTPCHFMFRQLVNRT